MSEREYDILLAETAGSLPPGPSEQSEPWRVAMRRILWGLALVTIKLELLGLNYLLPCLGAALVYLGFRSLRRSAPGFRLGWLVSIVLLVSAAACAVLAAARPVQSPDWLHWPLVALNCARDMCLLLGLRAGIRAAFERTEGAKPRDLALWAAAAYAVLFIFAIIWTYVPARSAVYSNVRGLAGLALYILLLLLLHSCQDLHPVHRPHLVPAHTFFGTAAVQNSLIFLFRTLIPLPVLLSVHFHRLQIQ